MNQFVAPEIAEKEIVRKDQAGRKISEFEGDHPRAWMQDFASPPRRVTGINTK
jgi:hypothetical protein